MKLTKIHKILKFKQSDWMKTYIHFNTKKRTKTSNSFEKYFFTLMIYIERSFKTYHKPTYIAQRIFGKKYAAVHKIKPVLTLNKAIYVGITALELSKRLVYDSITALLKKFDADAELFVYRCR